MINYSYKTGTNLSANGAPTVKFELLVPGETDGDLDTVGGVWGGATGLADSLLAGL